MPDLQQTVTANATVLPGDLPDPTALPDNTFAYVQNGEWVTISLSALKTLIGATPSNLPNPTSAHQTLVPVPTGGGNYTWGVDVKSNFFFNDPGGAGTATEETVSRQFLLDEGIIS